MCLSLCCNVGNRAANSKKLDHFAELQLHLEKILFLNSNKTVRVHSKDIQIVEKEIKDHYEI